MLKNIYISSAIFSLHSYLVIYINSSFLGGHFSNSELSLLYIIGAIINVTLLISLPKIIGKIGIHACTLLLIIIDFFAVLGLILDAHTWLIAISFTLHQATTLMILFMFDEYLEYSSKSESYTGRIRSVYLTVSSLALVISPTITGILATSAYGFRAVYSVSFLLLIPLFFIVRSKLRYQNVSKPYVGIRQALASSIKSRSSSAIILCRFILECFYAWMVIYMALYLTQNIGFGWKEVGSIFTIMLLPFLLFEIPLGFFSDKFSGEKKIIILGFIISAGAAAFIPFISTADFILWAAVLFVTRVGASFAEIGTESFFFKNVKGEDAGMISLFRSTRPLSFIVAPAIATFSLSLLTYHNTFFVLSGITLCGAITALMLDNSRKGSF